MCNVIVKLSIISTTYDTVRYPFRIHSPRFNTGFKLKRIPATEALPIFLSHTLFSFVRVVVLVVLLKTK